MKVQIILSLLLIAAFLIGADAAFSQQADPIIPGVGVAPVRHNDTHLRIFGGFGVNIGLLNDAPNAFMGFASLQHLHSVLSGGLIASAKATPGVPFKSWTEGDITYGYSLSGNDLGYLEKDADDIYLAISGGIGFFSYQENWRFRRRFLDPIDTNASHQNLSVTGIGIPVVVQAAYAVFKYVGFGVSLFANLNTYRINYGTTVSLELISPW